MATTPSLSREFLLFSGVDVWRRRGRSLEFDKLDICGRKTRTMWFETFANYGRCKGLSRDLRPTNLCPPVTACPYSVQLSVTGEHSRTCNISGSMVRIVLKNNCTSDQYRMRRIRSGTVSVSMRNVTRPLGQQQLTQMSIVSFQWISCSWTHLTPASMYLNLNFILDGDE